MCDMRIATMGLYYLYLVNVCFIIVNFQLLAKALLSQSYIGTNISKIWTEWEPQQYSTLECVKKRRVTKLEFLQSSPKTR